VPSSASAEDRAAKQRKAERERADKEAVTKARNRAKEFAALAVLPASEHGPRLAALAKRLDEDEAALHAAFAEYVAVDKEIGDGRSAETWPEPVNTQSLLNDILAQLQRYVVIHDDDAAIVCALAVLFAWVHGEIATYSPILVIQAADIEAAKTTLTLVMSMLTPGSRVIRPLALPPDRPPAPDVIRR
jgi:hypothetical protein